MTAREASYLSDQWRDYRSRTRLFLATLVSTLLLGALVAHYAGKIQSWPESGLAIVGFSWLGVFLVAALRLQFFPCPNCGRPFAFRHVNNLPFLVDACVHCGLPKWEH